MTEADLNLRESGGSPYMTTEEVASLVRIPAETLRYWRAAGSTGPASFKIGRRVLYAREDVEAFIDAARHGDAA